MNNKESTQLKICYFGIFDPENSRNKIYRTGLRSLGADIINCRDESQGIKKYWNLFWKHRKIKNDYDVMIVGYPGHVVVPFARLISRRPVIFDALASMYEGVVISRRQHPRFSLRTLYIRLIDWLAVKTAHITLVETQQQRRFFIEKVGANPETCVCVYTGADNTIFKYNPDVRKKNTFTVLFRGKFLPEAGVQHIIHAAKKLEGSNVEFLILGHGYLQGAIEELIQTLQPSNLTFVSQYLPYRELVDYMRECHISLGQFEDHERLKRTIPHKCFESLALALPYVTAEAEGVKEILIENETCLFTSPADPQSLADAILRLKKEPELLNKLSRNGKTFYERRFTPEVLAGEIITLIEKVT